MKDLGDMTSSSRAPLIEVRSPTNAGGGGVSWGRARWLGWPRGEEEARPSSKGPVRPFGTKEIKCF